MVMDEVLTQTTRDCLFIVPASITATQRRSIAQFPWHDVVVRVQLRENVIWMPGNFPERLHVKALGFEGVWVTSLSFQTIKVVGS